MSYYGTVYHNPEDDYDVIPTTKDLCVQLADEGKEAIENFLENFFALPAYRALEVCNQNSFMTAERQIRLVLHAVLDTTNMRDDLIDCVVSAAKVAL